MGQRLSDEEESHMAEVSLQQVEESRRIQEAYDAAMKPAEPFVLPESLP
jgi:hypothetical protein